MTLGKKEKNSKFSAWNSKLGSWRDKEEPAKETKKEWDSEELFER